MKTKLKKTLAFLMIILLAFAGSVTIMGCNRGCDGFCCVESPTVEPPTSYPPTTKPENGNGSPTTCGESPCVCSIHSPCNPYSPTTPYNPYEFWYQRDGENDLEFSARIREVFRVYENGELVNSPYFTGSWVCIPYQRLHIGMTSESPWAHLQGRRGDVVFVLQGFSDEYLSIWEMALSGLILISGIGACQSSNRIVVSVVNNSDIPQLKLFFETQGLNLNAINFRETGIIVPQSREIHAGGRLYANTREYCELGIQYDYTFRWRGTISAKAICNNTGRHGIVTNAHVITSLCSDIHLGLASLGASYRLSGVQPNAFANMHPDFYVVWNYGGTGLTAWNFQQYLRRVYVADGVEWIRNRAFEFSPFLEYLHVSSTVRAIGEGALNQAAVYNLEVSFAENSQLERIERLAFDGTALRKIEIPASVRYIGLQAFFWSRNLEQLIFAPNSRLETIGQGAFVGSRIRELKIPASVVTIGNSAFSGLDNLESVVFEQNSQLASIGSGAFALSNLTNIVIPQSVSNLGERAFDASRNLTCVVFEAGSLLTVIGQNTFRNTNLENIVLPEGLTTIRDGAFWGVTTLSTITIPQTITLIFPQAFYGWTSDQTVIIQGRMQCGMVSAASIGAGSSATIIWGGVN